MSLGKADKARRAAGWRILVVAIGLGVVMTAAATRFGQFAQEGAAARAAHAPAPTIETATVRGARAHITDRRGAPLVGAAPTFQLYLDVDPLPLPEDRAEAAARIAAVLPRWSAESLAESMAERRTTVLSLSATPLEAARARALGIPGLYRKERTERVYFGGRATSHVVGYVAADGTGIAGVEGALNAALAAPGADSLRLSLDLRVQHRTWRILGDAMTRYEAKAAAAVVLSVETGEIYAMVSLPDFDPHRLPEALDGPASPLFHWAINTGYEPGSVLKLVTWALALETGAATMRAELSPPRSIRVDGHEIEDHSEIGETTFPMAFARSSNVVAAQLALAIGEERQRAFFEALGLKAPTGVELLEARSARPQWHRDWRDSSTATTAYGHGVGLSPLHLAEATATLIGGGERVEATLIADKPQPIYRDRVVSAETSAAMRALMRLAVSSGTGKRAATPGLDVGGKTGTADKVVDGAYAEDKVVASFVAAFPMRAPEYVVVVMLDEPVARDADGAEIRYAGVTAAPTAGEIIAAIAPLLGTAPER